ncbi:MAG: signal recognition particle-docking protein FtsY [Deltaproteobacteria bacterium]|nr:signal recognition particle-docking protein FtsY [Deltaproteobacteria bacterium]
MSVEKKSDAVKKDAAKDGQKKSRGGLFGRLFGRREVSEVESQPSASDEASLKLESEVEVGDAEILSQTLQIEPEIKSSVIEPETETILPEVDSVAVEPENSALPGPDTGLSADVVADESEPERLAESEAVEKKEKRGLFSRLKQGLAKTRDQFVGTLDNLFYGDKEIDEEFLEELEEILLTSDLGVKTSYRLFSQIEEKVSHKELENPAHLRVFLQKEIGAILLQAESAWEIKEKPYVIMTIGVNGVGKTTTIGKLAAIFTKQKKKVVLGAADTFRAAAVEQLTVWAERARVPIIKQHMGADPAAVAFDTVQSAIKRDADIVIIDTAGRLHNKVNLMDELKKIQRVLGKALSGAPHEVLLVLDANTGQNAITQAQTFHDAIGVTGLVMTKLDGTAKGGVVVGVCDQLGVPVRYIGIGESIEDLRKFDSKDFVNALFDKV